VREPSIERVLGDLAFGTREAPVRLGRYDVVGRLGRGGMGTVYEAIDRERGTKVALKTLSDANTAAGAWLKREFRVVADLAHENLAAVYELASERGVWFFTMEHVDGRSLTEWARDERAASVDASKLPVSRTRVSTHEPTLPSPGVVSPSSTRQRSSSPSSNAETPTRRTAGMPAVGGPRSEPPPVLAPGVQPATPPTRDYAEIRRAFAELVGAIGALHEAGLRHGDVKPANVLVREDGRVSLVDFGLVRPMRETQSARSPSGGTPSFMAPEQLAGEPVGPEADWYAVGATLYRVLTGRLPFPSVSLIDLYVRKVHHLPAAAHELLPSVPLDLGRLSLELMSPDPTRRPSRDEILRVLVGETSAPEPSTERVRRGIFVGRDQELSALEQAYGLARGGTSTIVHTHGPSGIGKSALIRSFLSAVQRVDSAVVLRGRCYERETVPYKAFDRVLDDLAEHLQTLEPESVTPILPEWAGELGRAFPALDAVAAIAERTSDPRIAHDAIELRRRAWIALGDLLRGLGARGPVVVSIDDLQWADADSAHLLEELVRGATGALLFVVSFRPAEAESNAALAGYFKESAGLESRGRLVDLPLAALGPKEAEELALAALTELGAPISESQARRLASEAQGVPFFIEELAHFVGARRAAPNQPELSLDTAITARIDALPADQRALVEMVAVANTPLPQSIVFEAAGLDASALPALLALRSASLVSWLGAGADDAVSPYHDRIRESVVGALEEKRRLACHLAVGRALARRHADRPGHWVFDAIRHSSAAAKLIDDPDERLEAARLHAEAGERAQRAAAFPLAFECFEGGIAFLPEDAWQRDYALALRLHSGATEAAYLSAKWDVLERRIEDVKRHAKTSMDQVAAWEAQIDACIGKHDYAAALDAAREALALLDVTLPKKPTAADVGERVRIALERLTELGPERLAAKPDLTDPVGASATRIQVRVSPAAYFGEPMLLPVIACNLVMTSIERGVSTATPYALGLFGIVLNTIDLHPVAHRWGQLALELTERWPDRRLEAATKHLIFNLACAWVVPLHTVLEPLRQVFDIGCRTGDYEYASYAAHGYVHNAMYAGRPLQPLLVEALELGERMRALGKVNALHVHTPFEQLLKNLTGNARDPWRLDGDGFDEAALLASAQLEGSRSGIYVLSIAMGLSRFWFGEVSESAACFARARDYLDAAPSVWHQPIMYQFGGMASALAALDEVDSEKRARLIAAAEASREALRKLSSVSATNFAHRATMIEAAIRRVTGDQRGAAAAFDKAIRQAHEGGWVNDVALANELAAACEATPTQVKQRLRAARAGYAAWGATAKAEQLGLRITDLA